MVPSAIEDTEGSAGLGGAARLLRINLWVSSFLLKGKQEACEEDFLNQLCIDCVTFKLLLWVERCSVWRYGALVRALDRRSHHPWRSRDCST